MWWLPSHMHGTDGSRDWAPALARTKAGNKWTCALSLRQTAQTYERREKKGEMSVNMKTQLRDVCKGPGILAIVPP